MESTTAPPTVNSGYARYAYETNGRGGNSGVASLLRAPVQKHVMPLPWGPSHKRSQKFCFKGG